MAYRKTEAVLKKLAGKRAHILQAAIELADRDGLDSVTIENIARRARVAVGTIYLHFADRHEIRAALIADQVAEDVKRIAYAADRAKSPMESLAAAIAVFIDRFQSRKHLGVSLAREPVYRVNIQSEFERKIAVAIERRDIPKDDPSVLAAAAYGAICEVLATGHRILRKNEPSLAILALRAIGMDHARSVKLAHVEAPVT